jgi:hypothetical protein
MIPNLLKFMGAPSFCQVHSFFGLQPWYAYLKLTQDVAGSRDCSVSFTVLSPNQPSSILLVLLAVIDDLLRIAALVALGFIIYGAFQYVASQGSPDRTSKAQNTIIDSLIGLVIAIVSVAFVAFLGHKLGG